MNGLRPLERITRQRAFLKIVEKKDSGFSKRMMVSRSAGLVAELGEKCFVQRSWDVRSLDGRFLGGWSRNRGESAINGWDVSRRDEISGNG